MTCYDLVTTYVRWYLNGNDDKHQLGETKRLLAVCLGGK